MSAKSVVWHMVRYQLFGGWKTFITVFCAFVLFSICVPASLAPESIFVLLPAVLLFSIAPLMYSARIGKMPEDPSLVLIATRGVSRDFIFLRQLTISLIFLVVPMILAMAVTVLTQGDGGGAFVTVALFFLIGWLCHMAIISSTAPGFALQRMIIFLGLGWTIIVMIHPYFSFRLLFLQGCRWLSLYPLLTLVGIVLTGVLATWLSWRRFRRSEIA